MRVIFLSLLLAASSFAADITGTWNFSVNTPAGNGSPTFVFQQTGEKLTGTYTGYFGSAELQGTVKADDVEYSFTTQTGKISYKGKVAGTKMKGIVKLEELGEGTFEGSKK